MRDGGRAVVNGRWSTYAMCELDGWLMFNVKIRKFDCATGERGLNVELLEKVYEKS